MNFIFILIIVAFVVLLFRKTTKAIGGKLGKIAIVILFVIHYVAFLLHYKYNIEIRKDSFLFYQKAVEATNIFSYVYPGNRFMTFLAYPFASLKLSFFSVSFFFSTLSLVGFVIMFKIVLNIYKNNNHYFLMVLLFFLFTPSIHFWTSGLTKESIVLFLMTIILRDMIKYKETTLLIFGGLLLLLLIRPYLSVILVITYLFYNLFDTKKSLKRKALTGIMAVLMFAASLPILKVFLRVDALNYNSFLVIMGKIKDYSSLTGNSGVNLETSSYFERIFLVVFRPLFYDAKNIFQYIISLENLIFTLILITFAYYIITRKIRLQRLSVFLCATSVFIILFLSIYMYNLGLASRMRVMFIPYLIIAMVMSVKKECL